MLRLINTQIRLRALVLVFFFSFLPQTLAAPPRTDVLVFSSSPGDEIFACGGTILEFLNDNKTVKIAYLTGSNTSLITPAWPGKKQNSHLDPQDYISQQQQALIAINSLGLSQEDAIFLGYPETELLCLWRQDCDSTSTPGFTNQNTVIPEDVYNKTYAKENLLSDIKDILKTHRPRKIYLPHALDEYSDNQATAYFLNLALTELASSRKHKWARKVQVSYYLIHCSCPWYYSNESLLKPPDIFSQQPSRDVDIRSFNYQKQQALGAYYDFNVDKNNLRRLIKHNELFWDVPVNKRAYLKQLQREWEGIACALRSKGCHVNLAPVVDVASNTEDMSIYMSKRRRVYSEYPDIVEELALAVIKGMNNQGIIPVLKHFPGLGRVRTNPHTRLPQVNVSKKELLKKDLLPFKNLIKKEKNFWVMVDHAVYPGLSREPASLSREIQTELLREELGFKGIIIVDELLNMQSIAEFAYQRGIESPYIGEITVRAFEAGADLILIYLRPHEAEHVTALIVDSVKQAVVSGRLKEKELDDSLNRILAQKERIFTQPLKHLLDEMSIEQKIYQKIIADAYNKTDIQFLKSCNIGGIRVRKHPLSAQLQSGFEIPVFIVAEHEGGVVSEALLKRNTFSAYLVGKQFERITGKRKTKVSIGQRLKTNITQTSNLDDFSQLKEYERSKVISFITDYLDMLIDAWIEAKHQGSLITKPYISIFTARLTAIKPFDELPIEWVKRFKTDTLNLYAYRLIRRAFEDFPQARKQADKPEAVIKKLKAFKKHIDSLKPSKDKSWMRLLCLAVHPDDEDGAALVFFNRKFECSTYILLATRGEAGENKIGSVVGDELGLLRTQEMAKSAAGLGVEKVYYLGAADFGYCRELEDAFKNWDKQELLKRLVYFYRLIKPHIVISRHNSQAKDHCQHQAFIRLAEEAFDLAGDPDAYPEMIKQGLLPWQPLKLYERSVAVNRGLFENNIAMFDSAEVVTPEGETVYEVARRALNQHRSQGIRTATQPPKQTKIFNKFELIKSKASFLDTGSFFAGIEKDFSSAVSSIKKVPSWACENLADMASEPDAENKP